MEKNIRLLEKKIISGIMSIKNGRLTPKEAGLGKFLNLLKGLDEVSYEQLLRRYKDVIK